MAKMKKFGNDWWFHCPGCETNHRVTEPQWSVQNGDTLQPTVTPSLITDQDGPHHCHLTIENGVINFLSDSKHRLAGHSVTMLDFQD
jgi:hypothetical protein